MWTEELINLLKRINDTAKKIDPIITCNPWNPVAIKNVEPKDESAIQKGASIYSKPWNTVKIPPSIIVRIKENFALLKFFFNISWWDHVILTPEDNRRIVFSKGILIGLNEIIEYGGHICPISIVGEILLWKKAQKNDTKNSTSEAINKTIPVFNPFITMFEWFPCVVPSRWMSRHHEKAIPSTKINEINIIFMLTLFTKISPDSTNLNAPFEANKGQGLISTKWKGLNLFINILLLLCIA